MARDTVPTPDYVKKFAKRMLAQHSNQSVIDTVAERMEAMDQVINAAKSKGNEATPGKALRSGIRTQLNQRNAAIVTVDPFIRFNPPNPQDADDRKHSSLLESWANAALKKSGLTGVMRERLARSLMAFSRNWTKTCYTDAWGTPELDGMAGKRLAASEAGNLDEADQIKKEMEAYRRDRWPIKIEYVEPMGTYSYDYETLPEVIECRKMTIDEIVNAYGEEFAPKKEGSTQIDVYVYGNHFYEATLVKDTDAFAHYFEHGLGKSQYTLEETNLMATNRYGVRWFPNLYYAEQMIEAFDEVLSDWRTNTHDNAIGHMMEIYDPELRGIDIAAGGKPPTQDISSGGQSQWWKGESLELAPVPTLTQEHAQFRAFLHAYISQHVEQPVLSGETKSGDSQTLVVSTIAMAQRKFSPAMDAINFGQEDRVKTLLRCVVALNKEYDSADGVTIFDRYKGKGALTVKPKDVIGWEESVQAIGVPALPMDENRQAAIGQIKIGIGIPETQVFEEMGYEDPEAIQRQGFKEQGRRYLFENVILPTIQQRATQQLGSLSPQQQTQMTQLLAEASPELKQGIAQMMMMASAPPTPPTPGATGAAPGPPGNVAQGMMNGARAGVPQAPQSPMT